MPVSWCPFGACAFKSRSRRIISEKMSKERQAAISLRKLWQAHDERDEVKGWTVARRLYEILGAKSEQASYAGFLTIHAFFLSDDAERYQGRNSKMENMFYNKARDLLIKARKAAGLEAKSPVYTVRWWKAHRHEDKEGITDGLVKEHEIQFLHLTRSERERYANLCTQQLLAASKGHYSRQKSATDKILEEYFKIYFEAMRKRTCD